MVLGQWINLILLGGILGALGQGVRASLGAKKLLDQSGQDSTAFSSNFSVSRFVVSLFLGFVAGALTAFFLSDKLVSGDSTQKISGEILIGLMAAGYAGADAIEGFAAKIVPGFRAPGTTQA